MARICNDADRPNRSCRSKRLDEFRDGREQVGDEAVVGHLEDRRFFGSLLIATITFESFMPARCWIAPEMPTAMYSCGATILPVWPTCKSFGT